MILFSLFDQNGDLTFGSGFVMTVNSQNVRPKLSFHRSFPCLDHSIKFVFFFISPINLTESLQVVPIGSYNNIKLQQ